MLDNGTDMTTGAINNGIGRLAISRHPLVPGTAVTGQVIPGRINMSFADGHAQSWKLQNIKNVVWHAGYTPIGNPWSITP